MRISLSYVEVIAAQLRRAGIVKAIRGPGGGYMLAKPALDISLMDVANAVAVTRRKPKAVCAPEYWTGIDAAMSANFKGVCDAIMIGHLTPAPKKKAA